MLLRMRAASICGTDVKIVQSGHRKLQDGQRIVLGHEFVGDIEQVGARVEGYCVGQRVGVVPNAGCGRCEACMRGKANYCPTYTAFGIDRDGGHAEMGADSRPLHHAGQRHGVACGDLRQRGVAAGAFFLCRQWRAVVAIGIGRQPSSYTEPGRSG